MTIGIYRIYNLINKKSYIGQSWNIEQRWSSHRSNKNPTSKHLYASIKKYGIENFKFEILKELRESSLTQTLLDVYENFYIEKFNTLNNVFGYNKRLGGGNGKFSEEAKKNMSTSWTSERRLAFGKLSSERSKGKLASLKQRKIASETHKGLPKSEEHKLKIKLALTGHKHSKESKDRQSEAMKTYYRHHVSSRLGVTLSEKTKQRIKEKTKKGKEHPKAKPIMCIETGETFYSSRELKKSRYGYLALEYVRGKTTKKSLGQYTFVFITKKEELDE